ncbi:MAG: AAA family ATPase, partial [Planctomycetia bacterium]|nr:AAA family ATPase [Planctomycetia bacterium]
MKILAVRFENLNSLRGITEIRFDRPPFSGEGIFAITGPTGSGKSTIPDAICVALYGVTPRLPVGGETIHQLMTKHTSSCLAEVEFEVDGRRYQSRFELRRTRGRGGKEGKIHTKMILSENSADDPERWIPIAEKLKEVRETVARLTGLDPARFRQSVLLAQGEFAAFLKSDTGTRAELLEKITGTDVYRRISMYIYQRNRSVQEAYARIVAARSEIQPPSDEKMKELRETRKSLETELRDTESSISRFSEQSEILRIFRSSVTERDDHRRKLSELEEMKRRKSRDFERLRRATLAMPMTGSYTELCAQKKLCDEKEEKKEKLIREISGIEREQSRIQRTCEESFTALEVWLDSVRSGEKQLDVATREEQRLLDCEDKLTEIREERLRLEEKWSHTVAAQETMRQTYFQTRKEIETLDGWLEEHDSDRSVAESLSVIRDRITGVQSAYAEQKKRMEILSESENALNTARRRMEKSREILEPLREKTQRVEESFRTLEQRFHEAFPGDPEVHRNMTEQNLEKLRKKLEILAFWKNIVTRERERNELRSKQESENVLLSDMENRIRELQNHLEYLRSMEPLRNLREHLVHGTPCPLCGAMEHPYMEYPSPVLPDAIGETEEKSFSESLKKMEKEYRKSRTETDRREGILTTMDDGIRTDQERLQRLQESLKEKYGEIVTTEDFSSPNTETVIERSISNLNELRERIITDTAELNRSEREFRNSADILRTAEQNYVDMAHHLGLCEQKFRIDKEAFQRAESDTENRRESLRSLLHPTGYELPGDGEEGTFVHTLEKVVQEYHERSGKSGELHRRIEELRTGLNTRETTLREMAEQLKFLRERESSLTSQTDEIRRTLRVTIGDFPSVADARQAMEKKTEVLRGAVTQSEKQLAGIRTLLDTYRKDLDRVRADILSEREKWRQMEPEFLISITQA